MPDIRSTRALRLGAHAIGAAALATATLACSLLNSAEGLTGGAPPQDAGASAEAAPGAGAARDGAPADGGDASLGRWCDQQVPRPLLCDDFDDEGPLTTRWTSVNSDPTTSIARDDGDWRSPPSSLLTISRPDNASTHVYAKKTLGPKSRISYAFDVKIDTFGSYAEIAYIRVAGPNVGHAYYVRVGSGRTAGLTAEAYLSDGGVPQHNTDLGVDLSSWTRLVIDVDLSSTPHTMKATVNGKATVTEPLEAGNYEAGDTAVEAGMGYVTAGSPDWKIRWDNVAIDAQ